MKQCWYWGQFISHLRFKAGCYFGFISFSYCLVGKEEKKLINCTTINLWYDMAWAVITHSEKQFTNSSKNSIGKILSVKMIILCIISIYALAHYSHFLLTLGTVKHFPNVRILVGYSTACVTSWYNGISEEMVLTCIPLHFLGFSVFNTCFESLFDIIQIFLYFWGWVFSQYLYFQERCSNQKQRDKDFRTFFM